MDGGPSFASRRPAATGLPAFSLPPPDIPRVANDGLSPLSSGVNTGSSMGSLTGTTAGPAGVNYSYMSGSWPAPQQSSSATSYYGGSGNHHQVASPLLNQPFPNARSMYQQQVSPSVPQFSQSSGRHHLPDGLPPPAPYQQSSPVFLTPISGLGGGVGGANRGTRQIAHNQGSAQSQSSPTSSGPPEGSFRAQQQHHQQQQQQQQEQYRQQQHHHHQQQQQHHQHESNHQQHGVQYPYQRSTPQQSTFPTFNTNASQQPLPSPTARSSPPSDIAATSHAVSRAMSLSGSGQLSGMAPPMGFAGGRQGMSFPYQMTGPGGAIMSNMHQPGTPMVAVGNVNGMMPGGYNNPGPSPHGPHGLHIYGHPNQSQAHHDRPFKCDQCNQSFNRNHDLKRHKKIHLAVKPFPCTFCEKAFSRKDALKRHRLVKGCGQKMKGEDPNGSPPDRSDIMSDTTDGSPTVSKKDSM